LRLAALFLFLLLAPEAVLAQFPPQIKNVIVVFQENRTPDNLFHFLTPACPLPPNASGLTACTPSPVTSRCYDIAPCGISNQAGKPVAVPLHSSSLVGTADQNHTHEGFHRMCDPDPGTLECRNDGAWQLGPTHNSGYAYVANPAVTNSNGSRGHLLDPYLMLARQYGWANSMFQTNQGASYPAHLFIFGGTSARTAADDSNSTYLAENPNIIGNSSETGCLATSDATSDIISPVLGSPGAGCKTYAAGSVQECMVGNDALIYPTQPVGSFCLDHKTMADLLDPQEITWMYYAPSAGSIWTAPDSIKAICEPAWADPNGNEAAGLKCTGAERRAHVDTKNLGTDILRDIASCKLAKVSWVIPDGAWSDHAGANSLGFGPSWVAAVVNAIGNNLKCPPGTPDAGETYWDDTAIVITWDDWGGWTDHEVPPAISKLPCVSMDCPGDYLYGFRVPLIVVSAYTEEGYINNSVHDFGSILRMIEGINHLPEGALGFADKRAATDLHQFFGLAHPRAFFAIPALKDSHYFLLEKKAPLAPDDD
jgi:phospholipase C